MPRSCASACRSHLPLRAQYRQSSGWLLSSSSTIVRRASSTRGVRVWIFMPAATGYEQDGTRLAVPSSSTTHRRQAPLGARPSMWHSVGTWMPSRFSSRENRLALPWPRPSGHPLPTESSLTSISLRRARACRGAPATGSCRHLGCVKSRSQRRQRRASPAVACSSDAQLHLGEAPARSTTGSSGGLTRAHESRPSSSSMGADGST